jgi:hypothetical protein
MLPPALLARAFAGRWGMGISALSDRLASNKLNESKADGCCIGYLLPLCRCAPKPYGDVPHVTEADANFTFEYHVLGSKRRSGVQGFTFAFRVGDVPHATPVLICEKVRGEGLAFMCGRERARAKG